MQVGDGVVTLVTFLRVHWQSRSLLKDEVSDRRPYPTVSARSGTTLMQGQFHG
jgi:hypothetical protein